MLDSQLPTMNEFDEFLSQLAKHDWYYMYSDDHSVYKWHHRIALKLEAKAKENMSYLSAYNAWCDWTNTNIPIDVRNNKRDIILATLRDQVRAYNRKLQEIQAA